MESISRIGHGQLLTTGLLYGLSRTMIDPVLGTRHGSDGMWSVLFSYQHCLTWTTGRKCPHVWCHSTYETPALMCPVVSHSTLQKGCRHL